MSSNSHVASSASPYRLETLGTLSLKGPGEAVHAADQRYQPRRLALLAVLASSGGRGRSRDQLLLLFWPDATQRKARHSLDQLLYAIRSALHDSIFAGINPIRLNPDVIESDVADFERDLRDGNLQRAVEGYRGPFLDGFYLSETREFEDWLDGERARLAGNHTDALDRLARAAEHEGDYASTVRWRQKLAETDPLSSRYALALMRALADAGDYSAARHFAERYERIAAKEFGPNRAPEISKFIADLGEYSNARPAPPRPAVAAATEVVSDAAQVLPVERNRPEASASAPPLKTQRLWRGRFSIYLAVAALIVAIGAGLSFARTKSRNGTATGEKSSIAVLPLANLSADPRDAALANGLTDELTAILARTGHVRVIASTSVFGLRGSHLGAREIAESLQVSTVLRGSLQKAGSRMRVQIQMIDGRDGRTRWAETYDRQLADVFAVEDEIASAVARELDVRGGGDIEGGTRGLRHRTTNIAAYDLYLRGRDPVLLRADSTARSGLEYFAGAVALDPNFAAAYAGLAHMYTRLAMSNRPPLPQEELRRRAEAAARKAISLDDSLADGHAELGLVKSYWLVDLPFAESELVRALALDPGVPRAREFLSVVYLYRGRRLEALNEARRAVVADPLSPTARGNLAQMLYANGRCNEALPLLDSLRALRPELLRVANTRALCYAEQRRWPEAIAAVRDRAQSGGVRAMGTLGFVLARSGDRKEALEIRTRLLAIARENPAVAQDVAVVSFGLGDWDEAFVQLNRAAGVRVLNYPIMGPTFEPLRRDPRWVPIATRLGIQHP